MRGSRILLAGLMVAMSGAALVSQGRVFLRWGAAAESRRALEACGGEMAYEAGVNVNGGKGHLSVFRFNKSLEDLLRDLGQAFKGAKIEHGGGTMALVTVAADGRVLRMTAIQLGRSGRTTVFSLDQAESEARPARPESGALSIKDLPAYPGSEQVFFAEDERARMAMAVAQASADPAAVAGFYRASLEASGWMPALPEGEGAQPTRSLSVYLKSGQTCCVMVEPAAAAGVCRITLLHKRPGME